MNVPPPGPSIPDNVAPPPPSKLTWPDVAARLINDGPAYVFLAIVGAMALKGQAEAKELVISGLGTLLSRSWPEKTRAATYAGIAVVLAYRLFPTISHLTFTSL